MRLSPCLQCDRVPVGRMATAYCGWYDAQGVRQSYKAHYCAPCLEAVCLTPEKSLPQVDGYLQVPTHCFHCGGELPQDTLDVTYVTLYGPDGRKDLALGWCDECTTKFRDNVFLRGTLLEDRPQATSPQGRGGGQRKR